MLSFILIPFKTIKYHLIHRTKKLAVELHVVNFYWNDCKLNLFVNLPTYFLPSFEYSIQFSMFDSHKLILEDSFLSFRVSKNLIFSSFSIISFKFPLRFFSSFFKVYFSIIIVWFTSNYCYISALRFCSSKNAYLWR